MLGTTEPLGLGFGAGEMLGTVVAGRLWYVVHAHLTDSATTSSTTMTSTSRPRAAGVEALVSSPPRGGGPSGPADESRAGAAAA